MLLSVFLFGLVSLSPAFAQEQEDKFSGEISAQGTLTHINGNEAKFNEYRDIRNGLYGDVKLKYDDNKYYVDFYSRNMFYDTQSYDLEGGKWGVFKFNINYNEIPHNFTYDAQTLYSGAGTANLTYPTHPPSTNTGTWNTFDYSTKRKNSSAGFKIDVLKPFFMNFSAAIDERAGIYPIGAAGTTPGGIALELPAPIDYRTDSINLLGGYVRNPLYISLGYFYSNFTNSNPNLSFRNPATNNTASATDTYSLPPDNHYYKVNLKGALKLPLNSKFNVDLATASAKSDALLSNSYVVATGLRSFTLSTPFFNGKVDTNNFATSVTSKPLSFLDAKIFFKYDDRENKSNVITITDTTTFTNTLFNYRRVKYGTELGFQLPAKFYFLGTYNHSTISREREDIPDNRDDLFSAELRWKGVDFLAARIGYERLDRKAEFLPTDPTDIETFIRRFDAAGKIRDTYKANLDIFPTDNFSISLGYKHRETNYPDTILGLTGDKGDEFLIDVDYLINKRVRLFGSFDYERIRQDQFQRNISSTSGPVDPSTPPILTPLLAAFNWTAAQKDENYSYSAGAEIFIVPEKLTLLVQYSYQQADGSVDYTYLLGANPLPVGRTQDNIDLSNWDGYKLSRFLIKLSYNVTKSLSVATGYVYEKYDYNDAQYDGYQYVPAVTGTNGAYLTGAYNNPSYESHVGFVTLSYRF